MKVRVTVIEADGVDPADVGDVLARIFNPIDQRPALPSNGTPAALPPPKPATEAEPQVAEERPTPRRGRPPAGTKFKCGHCGTVRPADKDGRTHCAECFQRQWVEITDPGEAKSRFSGTAAPINVNRVGG